MFVEYGDPMKARQSSLQLVKKSLKAKGPIADQLENGRYYLIKTMNKEFH